MRRARPAPAIALALSWGVLACALAADVARAEDAGRPDAGARDGGGSDGGRGAGGEDAGRGDAGARPDEQPAIEAAPEPLPEGHRPQVELRIDPREGLATGDLVHVVLTVRLPEGDDVAVPRQSFGPFELHDQRHRDRPVDGGRREYVFEIDLLALEPGEHELPGLRLRVVTAEGVVGSVTTEPQRIVIGSLIANEPDAQPRPPTDPVPVMQDDYTLAWVLGIVGAMLLTALLTWLLARWWSRRPKQAPPPPPARPSWEIALAKLDALHKRRTALLEQGKHVELVDGVSDALREYFGARYDFNGLESTTDEVLARLRDVRPAGTTVQEVAALLGDCDLVKFAKAVPSGDECDRMIAGAVKIVRATMPGAAPAVARPARPAGGGGTGSGTGAGSGAGSGTGAGSGVGAQAVSEPATSAGPDVTSVPTQVGIAEPRRPVPVTRESPLVAPSSVLVTPSSVPAQAVVLPLVVRGADAVDAVVSGAVLGTVEARIDEEGFEGRVVVTLSEALPDEYASRQALRAVADKIGRAVAGRHTRGGRPIEIVIEHVHEPVRAAAEAGREPRKTSYVASAPASSSAPVAPSPGGADAESSGRPTPTGNAFDREGAPEGGAREERGGDGGEEEPR